MAASGQLPSPPHVRYRSTPPTPATSAPTYIGWRTNPNGPLVTSSWSAYSRVPNALETLYMRPSASRPHRMSPIPISDSAAPVALEARPATGGSRTGSGRHSLTNNATYGTRKATRYHLGRSENARPTRRPLASRPRQAPCRATAVGRSHDIAVQNRSCLSYLSMCASRKELPNLEQKRASVQASDNQSQRHAEQKNPEQVGEVARQLAGGQVVNQAEAGRHKERKTEDCYRKNDHRSDKPKRSRALAECERC